MNTNRRNFLKLSGAGMAVLALPEFVKSAETPERKAPKFPVRLGLASYTMRKFSLDDVIRVCNRMDFKYLSLKDVHLKLNSTDAEIAAAVQKIKDAGVELHSGGVIYMRNEAEIDNAFEYAKKAGMKTVIGVPPHELLPYVEKKVKAYDIRLAIHNHGPGDKVYPSCESAYVLIKDMDKRMGLCLDIGHTQRIGRDPSADLKDYFDRIYEIHIKDENASSPDGKPVEIGRGVIDIPGFLKTILKLKYPYIISFEYEKDADDPVPGLAESVGYVKGVWDVIS